MFQLKMKPLISIIIPVYNAGLYLDECTVSLLSNPLKDVEFIFINDGSTDNSFRILMKYSSLDPRVTVIDQENAGVSVARNRGIALAKGKFIAFVDADDWVQPDLYHRLAHIADNSDADLILFNMETTYSGNSSIINYSYPNNLILGENFIAENIYRDLILNDDLFSPCNKLYKKEIIDHFSFEFPPGNSLSEDNLFNLQYMGKIRSFYYLNFTGYFYREVQGSATRNITAHDYFENQRSLYHLNYRRFFRIDVSDEIIAGLKSSRFLRNVNALIYFYFTQPAKMSLVNRVRYVRKMVNSVEVREALGFSYNRLLEDSGRFEKAMMTALKNKAVFVLFLLVKYSQFRNR